MILPSKHLRSDRALLTIGGIVLSTLDRPRTVSDLWDSVRRMSAGASRNPIAFDWFVLSLDLLFMIGAISLDKGLISRSSNDS